MDLKHVTKKVAGTPTTVTVLNTGAVITAEDEAMLQALYSRSPKSIFDHLRQLSNVGSGKFMEQYYVGYGHKSIGDCGSTTLFIENISMLAAKAVQDTMLYSGQECSTRYIDFSTQPFINPLATKKGETLLAAMRKFYVESFPILCEHLKKQNPKKELENENVYNKAIAARAFDILRGFLPAGAATSVAWHTNLRQAADHVLRLRHHPLPEVRSMAETIEKALGEAHPHSFGHKRYEGTESYLDATSEQYYSPGRARHPKIAKILNNGIDMKCLKDFKKLLKTRPGKTELPKYLAEAGTLTVGYQIDFGSYRDIQRQRSVFQRMPLISTAYGFHEWYMDQLPPALQTKGKKLLAQVEKFVASTKDIYQAQYYVPMGYRVPCTMTGDLAAFVYITELRASKHVHPTLQMVANDIARLLEDNFGSAGLTLHIEPGTIGGFDTRRGKQDISKK